MKGNDMNLAQEACNDTLLQIAQQNPWAAVAVIALIFATAVGIFWIASK